MARPTLIWPLTLLGACVVLAALVMLGAFPVPTAAQDRCQSYPAGDPKRALCYATATAKAATQTASAYPARTATTGSAPPPPAPAATSTSTSTITPTLALSPTAVTAEATTPPASTSTPTSTRLPQGSASPTATSTLVGLETLVCAPGGSVTVSGQAEPGRALLAYFNARPVGGSLVRSDGFYALQLRIGNERPGVYLVEIRERDSLITVRSLACDVPGATATPTQALIP